MQQSTRNNDIYKMQIILHYIRLYFKINTSIFEQIKKYDYTILIEFKNSSDVDI